jgi:hypothetical protein
MDKNINSRIGIDHLNLKTLEMNCFDIRQPKEHKREIRKRIVFVEERGKEGSMKGEAGNKEKTNNKEKIGNKENAG